ncbi:MAG: NADH-quinone oxidoreductase subunit NuoE [Hyphomonas sp.]
MALRRFDLDAGGDSFSFKPETEDKIAFWRGKYPADKQRSAVIPMLWLAQKDNNGWLSEPAMREVADRLEMPYIRVYEVATFYTMFRLQPVGKYHVQLCGTTPCQLRGADGLKEVCTREIGKQMYVTDDKRLSWEEVECLGACVNAPMVQINDDYYEDLTPETLSQIIGRLKNGVEVTPGPQIDRVNSAPEGGNATLTEPALFDGSRNSVSELPNLPEPPAAPEPAAKPEPTPEATGQPDKSAPTNTDREEPSSKDVKE